MATPRSTHKMGGPVLTESTGGDLHPEGTLETFMVLSGSIPGHWLRHASWECTKRPPAPLCRVGDGKNAPSDKRGTKSGLKGLKMLLVY